MAVSEDDRLVGTLVADRYRVGRKLGEGGMGVVYLAVHEALHKQVALKVLGTMGRVDREAIARFEREAIAAANLKHPNIAEAMDFGQLPDGGLYLVMEYVEGTTLRALLAEQGKLAPARALAILQQVGSALDTAHARDVVHRDLKPDNVIVTSVPESSKGRATDLVKVIDFGIAKLRSATFGGGGTALTSAGTVIGTAAYMSPEQVMGQEVDARADQYALGVLAFELFTGKAPYKADDVGQLMMMHVGAPIPSTREQTPALPPEIDTVTMRMLAKLPDERFDSVADAMQALAAALSAPTAAPASPAAVAPRAAEPTAKIAPEPTRGTTHETTLPSPRGDADVPSSTARGLPVVAIGVGAASLLLGVLIVVLLARSCGAPTTLSPELAAALADWRNGKYEPAGAVIGSAVTATPALAELEAVSKPLAAPVADESARRALAKLLDTTVLGHSRGMVSALAEVAVTDDPRGRDAALGLLRGRQALLSNEQGARVGLRDADTCELFDAAKRQATEAATTATQRDLERLGRGECKAMLRVGNICEACAGGGPATENARPRAGSAPAAPAAPAAAPAAPAAAPAAPAAPAAAPAAPAAAPAAPGKGKGKGKGKK